MVKISDSRRAELKKPLGILIADKDITAEAIAKHAGVDASYITVGDASTERASTLGLNVCMEIVDCLEKRVSRSAPNMRENFTIIRCTNPPGHITADAEAIIYETMEKIPGTRVRIIVDGEEDLLVLPVCARAKDGFTVLYGQPNEGIIVVRADLASRNKAKSLLDSIK